MAATDHLGGKFAQMTPEEYEAAAGPGRRWVYHATDKPEAFSEGVRMANIEQNVARQRFQAGEYAEFAPGRGIGQGTYVSSRAHEVSGFGRHMLAFAVPTEHLAVPPEADDDDLEFHLRHGGTGALLTHDVEPVHVVNVGRALWASMSGHEMHQLHALRAGEQIPEHLLLPRVREHVRFNTERGWEI